MQRKVAKFHGKQVSVIPFQFCQGLQIFITFAEIE